jgi:hypothetical protein
MRGPGASVCFLAVSPFAMSQYDTAGWEQRQGDALSGVGESQPFQVGVDHHRDELFERDVWRPAEISPGAGGIGDEEIDFGGPEEPRVDGDVRFRIEADVTEGDVDQLSAGVQYACADDVVGWLVLLEHEPHGTDIIRCIPPVASCFEVTKAQFSREATRNTGNAVGDFPGKELHPATR